MKCKSKKCPKQIQHPIIDLKMEFLFKLVHNFKLYTILVKSSILDVPQVLTSSLTTINQTFITNNKSVISQFFRTVALPAQPGFYLFKVNNRNTKNTRARYEMCLKLTVRTPERRQWLRSGVFIANFHQISHIRLVFPSGNFEQTIVERSIYFGSEH